MRLYDPELAQMVDSQTKVEIEKKLYTVQSNRSGLCDGCAFIDKKKCPQYAITICTSNGGNILKAVEE